MWAGGLRLVALTFSAIRPLANCGPDMIARDAHVCITPLSVIPDGAERRSETQGRRTALDGLLGSGFALRAPRNDGLFENLDRAALPEGDCMASTLRNCIVEHEMRVPNGIVEFAYDSNRCAQ